MTRLAYEIDVVLHTCCSCGTPIGISTPLNNSLKDSGDTFYCPNGHGQHYTKTTKEKLRQLQRKYDEEVRRGNAWRKEANRTADDLRGTKNSLRSTKGAMTKLKKRIANGVCPCCHRQFENLQRHMETKHPTFKIELEEAGGQK